MNRLEIDGEEFTWTHVESITAVAEGEWDACSDGHPLVRHGFFLALELSGSVGPDRGVVPGYFLLRDGDGRLVAAVPTALKWGNLREFGPEIRWLNAGLNEGCFRWPKFQACSPFYPQIAPKLLIHPDRRSASFRAGLLRLLIDLAAGQFANFSLMHISDADARECSAQGALISREPGSLWTNPGVSTFEDYMAQLPRRKRKLIRRDRAHANGLGLTFAVRGGAEVSPALIDDFYAGYRAVCQRYGGAPWVPQALFEQFCQLIPDAVQIFTAHDGDDYVAGAFRFQSTNTLFNQTWSAIRDVPGLIFEMACYRSIEYAIESGLSRIDAGLSIPYKAERGYLTEPVFNAHWFFDERLAALARAVLSAPEQSEAQRLLEVGQQVGDVLDADRQPHQVVGNLQL